MKPLDLLLVNPPSRVHVYGPLSKFAAIEPPVWAGLIARHCLDRGFSVEILDAEAEGIDAMTTASKILSREPRLAAFCIYGHQPSASTQCMPGAVSVLKFMDAIEKDFGAKHVETLALGTHPSALPAQTLTEGFDYVAEGEGWVTIDGLLDFWKKGSEVAGISAVPGLWLHGDPGDLLPPEKKAPLSLDLDVQFPVQAWSLLDMDLYRPLFWHQWTGSQNGGYASVQTSLGCPFKCSFCCINAPFGGPGYRVWSPRVIADQIELLVDEYGITNIKIPDEMFVLNRKHVEGVCGELIRRGLARQLNMWAYARIDTVKDDALLGLLRTAGFRWLGIGIESGSKHVRDGVEKGRFGEEDILAAIARVHGHGLHVGANYIFGLPDDTHSSMQATLDLAMNLNTAHANFYCAMAYPGSPLHGTARQMGWRLPEDPPGLGERPVKPGWIGYSQHSYESLPLRTVKLTSEQVLDFRDNAFMEYHTSPAYLGRLLKEFGPHAVKAIEEITALGLPKRWHRDPL